MTEIAAAEATWTCGCTSEHRPTIGRAWCFDCHEWCYPMALCVRGENEQLRAEVEWLRQRYVELVEAGLLPEQHGVQQDTPADGRLVPDEGEIRRLES